MRVEGALEREIILPIGVIQEDKLYKKAVVRELIGFDEEVISDNKFRNNPAGMLTELIFRCLVSIEDLEITRDLVRNMFIADRDTILLTIRELTNGEELETELVCPYCEYKNKEILTISSIPIKYMKEDELVLEFPFELKRGIKRRNKILKKGKLRLLTGIDQEIILKESQKSPGKASSMIILRSIVTLDGESPDSAIVGNMFRQDRKYLLEKIKEISYGPDLVRKIECQGCGREFEDLVEIIDFFG